ncbi:zinc-dependent alcohol dehydrogenase [Haloplanus halophilus]|uniref:zinc-dependent alcohol dehydrogenase n=1 Tax=Haloplanus halophilus TaxID=2949993 RepID=UPI00204127F1|nr:alcohol dehydrogenase catalytic domain-containing protein [Haloplanus sp. GDY1]
MPTDDTTESMVLTGPKTIERRAFEVPDVSTAGALLEVEMTSVCGTDIGLYSGQEHFSNLPLIMGHEVVGRVVDGAEGSLDKMGVEVGDRVMPEPYVPCYDCQYCQSGNYHMCEEDRCFGVSISCSEPPHLWGGYGEYMYLPPNTRVHAVAEETPAKAACLGSVIGNGVRWIVEKGDVDPGDDVVVIGPGAQGLASVVVADEAGADPIVLAGLSTDDHRLDVGASLGATDTVLVDEPDPEGRIDDLTGGDGAAVVVVTAPSSQAIQLGLEVVEPQGRVVLPGLVGDTTEIDTDSLVHDEVMLIGGRGQALNVERAMDIVAKRGDDIAAINTHEFAVRDAATAIEQQLPGDEFTPDITHAVLTPE